MGSRDGCGPAALLLVCLLLLAGAGPAAASAAVGAARPAPGGFARWLVHVSQQVEHVTPGRFECLVGRPSLTGLEAQNDTDPNRTAPTCPAGALPAQGNRRLLQASADSAAGRADPAAAGGEPPLRGRQSAAPQHSEPGRLLLEPTLLLASRKAPTTSRPSPAMAAAMAPW
jgi:hypothetical protein